MLSFIWIRQQAKLKQDVITVLLKNNPSFVRLFLEKGVQLGTILDVETLEYLYTEALNRTVCIVLRVAVRILVVTYSCFHGRFQKNLILSRCKW